MGARWFLGLAIGCLLTSCGVFEDDPPPIIEGDWQIERPKDTDVEPGEALDIRLMRVSAMPAEVRVYIDDLDTPLKPRFVRDGDVLDDGDMQVQLPAPFLTKGEHVLRFGTADGVFTGKLPFDVTVPKPRLSQAAAAAAIGQGTTQIALGIGALVNDPDPKWQATLASYLPSQTAAAATQWFDAVGELGAFIEEDYNAIPPDVEPAVQCFFEHAGLLSAYEGAATNVMALRRSLPDVQTLLDKLPHIQTRIFFLLDWASLALSATNDAIAIINVLAIASGAAAPLALAGLEAQLALHLVRYFVDNVLPTDLVGLESMVQPKIYAAGQRWYYWGKFQPENMGWAGITSLDNIIATVAGELIEPQSPKGKLAKDLLLGIAAKIGLRIPTLFGDVAQAPDPTIKMIVNMSAYSITVGDIALLIPGAGWFVKALTSLFDPEVFAAMSKTTTTPPAADPGNVTKINLDYSKDLFSVSNVPWDMSVAPAERVLFIGVRASGYSWSTVERLFFSAPMYNASESEDQVELRYVENSADPNDTAQDKRLFITKLGVDYDEYVSRFAPATLQVPVSINDLANMRNENAALEIYVNDQLQQTLTLPQNQLTNTTLTLSRGRNLIRIKPTAGHPIGTPKAGVNWPFAVQFTFPQVVQVDKSRAVYLPVGGTPPDYTLVIDLPPAL